MFALSSCSSACCPPSGGHRRRPCVREATRRRAHTRRMEMRRRRATSEPRHSNGAARLALTSRPLLLSLRWSPLWRLTGVFVVRMASGKNCKTLLVRADETAPIVCERGFGRERERERERARSAHGHLRICAGGGRAELARAAAAAAGEGRPRGPAVFGRPVGRVDFICPSRLWPLAADVQFTW
jgi:hypothetical protein